VRRTPLADAISLSDADVESLRRQVGRTIPLKGWHEAATADAIWHFAAAVGDDNPLWFDREHAGKTRWGGLVAPPTYFYTCERGLPTPLDEDLTEIRDDLLPNVPSVWIRSSWKWQRLLRVGERVRSTWELAGIRVVTGRSRQPSVHQIEQFTHRDAGGEIIAEEIRDILRRPAVAESITPDALAPRRLSASETAAIAERYALEAGRRERNQNLCWEDVDVGTSLGPITKGPLTLMNLVSWLLGWGSPMAYSNRLLWEYLQAHPSAAVLDQSLGVLEPREARHLVPDLAREVGFLGGYDFGAQRITWIVHLLTDFAGANGFVSDVDVKLRRPNVVGSVALIQGHIAGKELSGDVACVNCAITVVNESDEVLADSTATVILPRKEARAQ